MLIFHCGFCCTEQIEKDIDSAKKVLADAEAGVVKLQKELAKLNEQVAASEVREVIAAPSQERLSVLRQHTRKQRENFGRNGPRCHDSIMN